MDRNLTLKDFREKIKQGESVVKITEGYFERIEQVDPKSLTYLTLNKSEALKKAGLIDKKIAKGKSIGSIEGAPASIKDVLCTRGLRTTAASKILDNFIPPYDATSVSLLKKNGAVILGKTNCDEFAMGGSGENSAYGVCPNPLDKERVPGGSSSGGAVAVAENLCIYSIGSDTGGSVRLPASFCGICGMKPTYGRISRYGLIAMASSLDQVGIMANNVSDIAEVLNVIAEPDTFDSTSSGVAGQDFSQDFEEGVKGLKIAYNKDSIEKSDPAIAEASFSFLRKWEKAGGKTENIEIPFLGKEAVACYYIITTSEVSSNMARFDSSRYGQVVKNSLKKSANWSDFISLNRGELLGKEVKRRIVMGTFCLSSGYYDAYYGKAQRVRMAIRKNLAQIFKQYPLIFTPTSPDLPFKIGERLDDPIKMYLADAFTTMANLAGIPAISFPVGNTELGGKKLSIGGQLMANSWDEKTLLRGAYWGQKIASEK